MTPNNHPSDSQERLRDAGQEAGTTQQEVLATPSPVSRGAPLVVDDIKIDADGWQLPHSEWTVVDRRTSPKKQPAVQPALFGKAPRRVWRETAASKVSRVKSQAEARRSRAMVDSLYYGRGWGAIPPATRPTADDSEEKVDVPSGTASPIRLGGERKRTAKSTRRTLRRQAERVGLVAPLPSVTKAEAAAPVAKRETSLVASSTVERPRVEPRGPGIVEHHKEKGSTFIDNAASRLATTTFRAHHLRQTHFVGVARKLMSDSLFSELMGELVTLPENFEVKLPSNCVPEFGAWWVGRAPSADNYSAYQEFVRRWCQRVDWPDGISQEDCLLYGAYLGFVTRATERADLARRVHGRVFTQCAQGIVLAGAAIGGLMSMPVAAASVVVGAPVAASLAIPVAAVTAATLTVALAVKWALPWFAHDMAMQRDSKPIQSVTATAPPPDQKPDAIIERVEARREHDKTRIAAHPTGTSLLGYDPIVFAQNQDNVVAALQKRSAALAAPGDRKAFLAWVDKYWEVLISRIFDLRVPLDPVDQDAIVEDWLATSHSSPAVKTRVRLAWCAMRADGHHMHTPVPAATAWEWSKRDVSCKNETLTKDESGHPRQIMAASPQFVALVAPFVKRLTGVIRKALRDGPLVYAPGRSEEEISAMATERDWDQSANEDFNAYDSNQGLDMGEGECRIFRRYGSPPATRQVLKANLEVHGGSREGVKFQVPYCRLSGDPQTTLMNTVWNLLANSYVYCQARNCHPSKMDVLFFAGGDDAQLNYNGERIDFEAGLAALGLPATTKHVENRSEIEFLSCRLTRTSRGWRYIPKLGRLFIKFAYSIRASEFNGPQILKGAVNSVRAQLSGSPIGQLLVAHWDRISAGAEPIAPKDEPWKMTACHTGVPTQETWDDLYVQYGWTRELHEALERDLASVRTCGVTVSSSALQILVDTDTSRKDFALPRQTESDSESPPQVGGFTRDLTREGIEPNPGWAISGKARNRLQHSLNGNRRSTANGRANRVRRRNATALVVRVPRRIAGAVQVRGPLRTRRRRTNAQRGMLVTQGMARSFRLGAARSDVEKYMCTLNDPFNCPPVRLGAGCALPTSLATLFFSVLVTPTAANTSYVIYPRPANPVLVSATGGASYTYTVGPQFAQLASLVSLANAVRPISCGIKVTSTASATNDSGLITAGLIPRDNYSPFLITNATPPVVTINTNTQNGLPFIGSTTATQGFNEFLNYEQTEAFALRKGATVFYRPEDPEDLIFKSTGVLGAPTGGGSIAADDQQMSYPEFVIGIAGSTVTTGTTLIEMVLHVEYTVGPFSNSVVNLGTGSMTENTIMAAIRQVFPNVSNTVKEGIASGFNAAGSTLGSYIRDGAAGAAGNIVNRVANYFSSTDAQGGTALVPTGRRNLGMMEVD